jgi:hypothetical protein
MTNSEDRNADTMWDYGPIDSSRKAVARGLSED